MVGPGRVRLAHALSPQHDLCGLEQDHQIEEQAVVLDVVEVVLQLVHGILVGRAIGVAHLGPPGDARFDGMTYTVIGDFLGQVLHEVGALRTRADKAHVAKENVEYLRQLVDAGAADETSGERHAAVVLTCPARLAVFLGIDAHAAELENGEIAAALADALLAVEHRAGTFQFDQQGGQRHDRQADSQHGGADHEVEETFDGISNDPLVEAFGQNHPAGIHRVDLQMAVFAFEEAGQFKNTDAIQLAFQQVLHRHAAAASIAHRENDLADLQAKRELGQRFLGVENPRMIDEMMTPSHRQIADDLDIAGAGTLGQHGFDMRSATPGADYQGAGLERADTCPANEQGAAQQNPQQRQPEGQKECATPDQQDGKEIKHQAHGHQTQPETQTQALQQGTHAALPFEVVQSARCHQAQHDDGEGQGLGQQGVELGWNYAAIKKAGAHPGIDRSAQDQGFDQHQQ